MNGQPYPIENIDIQYYDSENSQRSILRNMPRVSVYFGNRMIRINKTAMKLAGLEPTDRIILLQDKNNPKQWYLAKSPKGFFCTSSYNAVYFLNAQITAAILHSFLHPEPIQNRYIRLTVEAQPKVINGIDCYPLKEA